MDNITNDLSKISDIINRIKRKEKIDENNHKQLRFTHDTEKYKAKASLEAKSSTREEVSFYQMMAILFLFLSVVGVFMLAKTFIKHHKVLFVPYFQSKYGVNDFTTVFRPHRNIKNIFDQGLYLFGNSINSFVRDRAAVLE